MTNHLRLVTPDFIPHEPLEPNRFDTCYEGPVWRERDASDGSLATTLRFADGSAVEFDYDAHDSSLGSLKWETRQQIGVASFALIMLHRELGDEVHWRAEAFDHHLECSQHFKHMLRLDRHATSCDIEADSLPSAGEYSSEIDNPAYYRRSYRISSDHSRLQRYVRVVLDRSGTQTAAEALRLTASPTVAAHADQIDELFRAT